MGALLYLLKASEAAGLNSDTELNHGSTGFPTTSEN